MNIRRHLLPLLLAVVLPSASWAQSLLGNNPVLPQIHASALEWADFDGDGDADLLMLGTDSAGVAVVRLLRNDLAMTFQPVANPFHIWTMASAAWGDVDGDGKPDLLQTGTGVGPASSGGGKGALALWHNQGFGVFAPAICSLPGLRAGSVAWADLDLDGDMDCILSGQNYDRGYLTVVGRNDGGVLYEAGSGLPGICCGEVLAGDLAGNALPELLVTGQNQRGEGITRVLHNDGGLQFTEVGGLLPDMMDGSVAVADMEGDGDGDLMAMGLSRPFILGLWRNNAGVIAADTAVGQSGVTRGRVRWADFDGDGLQDVVYGGMQSNGTFVTRAMRQFPVGVFSDFQPSSPLLSLQEPFIAVADWNGDGHPDLALSGIDTNGFPVALLYKWNTTLNKLVP